MAQTGIQIERDWLLRLWYIAVTGKDCGKVRSQTIFGMTRVMRTVEQVKGAEALAVRGASLEDRDTICRAIEQLRDEVAKAGLSLAESLGFSYPFALEAVARQGRQDYTGLS